MWFYAVFLINLTLFGVYTKPMDRSIADSTNRIDRGSPIEIRNEDEASTLTFQEMIVQNSEGSTTAKPGFLAWLLTPLAQTLQINPQSLLQNGVVQLKETLNNLGLKTRENIKAKQLNDDANNLLRVPGINDPGFYRLEPTELFDGNGWLVNEGGISRGPGTILSTGNLLTDYPTTYRRK